MSISDELKQAVAETLQEYMFYEDESDWIIDHATNEPDLVFKNLTEEEEQQLKEAVEKDALYTSQQQQKYPDSCPDGSNIFTFIDTLPHEKLMPSLYVHMYIMSSYCHDEVCTTKESEFVEAAEGILDTFYRDELRWADENPDQAFKNLTKKQKKLIKTEFLDDDQCIPLENLQDTQYKNLRIIQDACGTMKRGRFMEMLIGYLSSSGKTFNNIEEILECTKHLNI